MPERQVDGMYKLIAFELYQKMPRRASLSQCQ